MNRPPKTALPEHSPNDPCQQFARLFHILWLVQSRRERTPLGRGQLATACKCSTQTIQRDIAFVRDHLQIGIEYSRAENAYRFTDNGQPFFAPHFDLTDTLALAMAAVVAAGSVPSPQGDALRNALGKISSVLRPVALRDLFDSAVAGNAASVFRLPEMPRDYGDAPVLELARAIREGRTVELDYTSYSGGGRRERRRIDPYQVEPRAGVFWEVHGWCHKRQAMRTFALDNRLHEARPTYEPFPRRQAEWDAFCREKSIGGLRAGNEPVDVDAVFAPDAARYALAQRWPDGLTIAELPAVADSDGNDAGSSGENRIRARLTGTVTSGIDGLLTELLRWRRHVQIIGGTALRERIRTEIDAMAALYRTDTE